MGQPVRQKIKETYGEEVGRKPIYTLLVDGNSLLKVAMRDEMVNDRGEHVGGIFQFFVQLKKLMVTRDWDYVYCFFDDKFSGILRYNIYHQYKANRDKHYEDYGKDEGLSDYMKEVNATVDSWTKYFKKKKYEKDISEGKEVSQEEQDDANFQRERALIFRYLEELFIRWEMDENGTEADDLIAYYIKNKKPEEKCVIVSADMDLTQLLSDDVYIYNPHLHKNITNRNFKKEFGYPHENVVTKKILCGDSSDNISNISLLSEKKLFETVPEMLERAVTVEEVIERARELIKERIDSKKKPLKVYENIVNGVPNKEYDGDFYKINRKLVDLSEPMLTDEAKEDIDAMMHAPIDPEGRSFSNIYRYIQEDGISELYDESKFSTFFSSFKPFIKRETERFNKSV
jgi:5'-3' exonuclease